MILLEGGNAFPDVDSFDQKDVPIILKTVNNLLDGTGVRAIPVGSAATPVPGKFSGDMDVIVDEQAVMDFFKVEDAKSGRKALSNYIAGKGLKTAQTGTNVHVRVPVDAKFAQVDIMVARNSGHIVKFHTHNIPANSPYKGVNKQLMLAILAKNKGYMWSAWQGLFSRTPDGKKGELVSDEIDIVAQTLFGPNGSAKDMGSVEAIMAALPKDEAAALLDRARQDPNWKELPVKQESTELNRIKQLSGL